jgi:hypothetical protein
MNLGLMQLVYARDLLTIERARSDSVGNRLERESSGCEGAADKKAPTKEGRRSVLAGAIQSPGAGRLKRENLSVAVDGYGSSRTRPW